MRSIVVMGVSGSGKSTVGAALAQRLGVPFADADDFHPPANIAKMFLGALVGGAEPPFTCPDTSHQITRGICNCGQIVGTVWARGRLQIPRRGHTQHGRSLPPESRGADRSARNEQEAHREEEVDGVKSLVTRLKPLSGRRGVTGVTGWKLVRIP